MKNIYEKYEGIIKKEGKIVLLSILAGCIFTTGLCMYTKYFAENVQASIADEVVRFHVRANSNSEEDQALKIKVKDEVLAVYHEDLVASQNKGETEQYLTTNLEDIDKTATEVVRENGYDYEVTVNLGEEYFPTKIYGDITMPPGVYKSLSIDIGEGEGDNWWCVMFPPLCYVDVTKEEITPETKEKFETLLTEEEYDLIVNEENEPEISVKFKIVEFWKEKDKPEESNNIVMKD